ncbi:MAG: hypothetical protein NTZ67_02860 [Gammaproteobacteria bacterium]|nr:hypothetical protein [Gammaproteobacteria bacterium]
MSVKNTNHLEPYHHNFWIANFVNALFFSGYLILKFPLAFILAHQGISLTQAYTLTTTASIAFALCSLALTLIMKNYHDQKHALFLGITLNLAAALLLETRQYHLEVIGMACYVLGGGLYFFNVTLLFNKQFVDPETRLRGNYVVQIYLNIGAFIGSLVFLFAVTTGYRYFAYSIFFIIASLLLLITCYWFLEDAHASLKQQLILYGNCIALFFLILLCLQHAVLTRWLVLTAFILVTLLCLYQSNRNHERGYFSFIILVLLFSLPYWIGNTILYNQFFVFLHASVLPFIGLPATFIILLDPLGNILFGLFWGRVTRNASTRPYFNLQLGIILMAIAFGILALGLLLHSHATKISAIYPIATLLLFASAQFLIQPTMSSRVTDLIPNHQHMLFALGVLRSVRAFAAILAFYLINMTVTSNQAGLMQKDMMLYAAMAVIALLALGVFRCITRTLPGAFLK